MGYGALEMSPTPSRAVQPRRRRETSPLRTAGVEVGAALTVVGLAVASQLHGPRLLTLCALVGVVGVSGFVGYRINRTHPHG